MGPILFPLTSMANLPMISTEAKSSQKSVIKPYIMFKLSVLWAEVLDFSTA